MNHSALSYSKAEILPQLKSTEMVIGKCARKKVRMACKKLILDKASLRAQKVVLFQHERYLQLESSARCQIQDKCQVSFLWRQAKEMRKESRFQPAERKLPAAAGSSFPDLAGL